MNKKKHTHIIIRSSLALALALVIWAPMQTQSAEPMDGMHKMDGKMSEQHKGMMEQKSIMMEDLKAQDTQLSEMIAQMNSASAEKKVDLLAAIVTKMVEQKAAMTAHMEKMHSEMMSVMKDRIPMDKDK